jgi:hypothetical protein
MRLIAILISVHFMIASLLSNNEFAGLVRMGNLVTHFYHHLNEHKEDISFIEFLALHYLDQSHLQKDKHEHEELPLHNHTSHCQAENFIIELSNIFEPYTYPAFIGNKSFNSFYIEHFFKGPLLDIWQPPKLG